MIPLRLSHFPFPGPMLKRLFFALGILGGIGFTSLFGQIQGVSFDTTTVTRESSLGQQQVVATFPFEVIGKKAVRILNTRSSCGCTTAELEKNLYRPGETGKIEARFVLGNRQGLQRNVIHVITDRGTEKLFFEVKIPKLWELSSRVFIWKNRDDSAKVEADLQFHPERSHEILGFEIEDNMLQAKWEVISPGQHFRFTFTPTGVALPENAVIVGQIRVLDAMEETYSIPVYFKF